MELDSKVAVTKKQQRTLSCYRRADAQIGKLQRLTQPYFLPLENTTGWHFLWLLLSMVLVIACGATMLLASTLGLLSLAAPDLAATLGGSSKHSILAVVSNIWGSIWGAVILGLFGVGVVSFVSLRRHLRERRWVPWALLGLIVLMLLLVNAINTAIGFIYRDLTNALTADEPDKAGFYTNLAIYGSCFLIALPIRTGQYYFTAKLGILWRQWLSNSFITDYMSNRAYYALNPNDEETTEVDNPDQRMTEDTRTFCRQSLDLTVGVVDALLSFGLNIAVLWSISKTLTLALFLWCVSCTGILLFASRNLVRINFFQLRYEADFRYGLVHIRNNAEAIAFYAGEEPEMQEMHRRLGTVVHNFNRLIKWEVVINVLRRMYNYAGVFFPYLIMAPAFFAGEVRYGSFVQANFAFSMVEGAVSFIIQNIDELAKWSSGISRLEGFQSKIHELKAKKGDDGCEVNATSGEIVVRGAELHTPGGEHLVVRDLSLSIGCGERVLVVGPSGCGKTSVLRMLSGLWQPSCGEVERPPVGELLFIPQKPYMLLGSLREQLCYPLDPSSFSDEQLRDMLKEVNLMQLVNRYPDFSVKQDWPRLLSLGEQQRLAFARLLLNRPRFAVLDEATSALDVTTERRLYELLLKHDIAVVSVGHRPSLKEFHENVLELTGNGGWRLLPAARYDFGGGSDFGAGAAAGTSEAAPNEEVVCAV